MEKYNIDIIKYLALKQVGIVDDIKIGDVHEDKYLGDLYLSVSYSIIEKDHQYKINTFSMRYVCDIKKSLYDIYLRDYNLSLILDDNR